MKIAFFSLSPEDQKFIQANLPNHELAFIDSPLKENFLPNQTDFEVISVFVSSKITAKVIDHFPNLKLIIPRSTGFDNVDLDYAKQKDIQVRNIPAYGSHTVAEFTFALILALSRKIPEAYLRIKEEKKFDYTGLRGFDLNEKTLGVIGTGKIGANVIKIAKSFNLKIISYDAFPNEKLKTDYGFEYLSLDELLSKSDIITIHAPYNKDTHHLLNANNMPKIKKGAFLINTARGAIVESSALLKTLEDEILSGAALDVLEDENSLKTDVADLTDEQIKNLNSEKVIMELPQVIVTPHMAFYTEEAEQNIIQTTLDNIKFFENKTPENIVNG